MITTFGELVVGTKFSVGQFKHPRNSSFMKIQEVHVFVKMLGNEQGVRYLPKNAIRLDGGNPVYFESYSSVYLPEN